DLERQPTVGAAQPAGDQRGVDLPDEVERLVRPGVGVGAVDLAALLEDVAQPLRTVRNEGELGGRRAVGADPDPQAAGVDPFARDLGIPEREDVADAWRAHWAGAPATAVAC